MLRIGDNEHDDPWCGESIILSTETACLIQNTDKEKYSLILANPPFKGSLDYDIVSAVFIESM